MWCLVDGVGGGGWVEESPTASHRNSPSAIYSPSAPYQPKVRSLVARLGCLTPPLPSWARRYTSVWRMRGIASARRADCTASQASGGEVRCDASNSERRMSCEWRTLRSPANSVRQNSSTIASGAVRCGIMQELPPLHNAPLMRRARGRSSGGGGGAGGSPCPHSLSAFRVAAPRAATAATACPLPFPPIQSPPERKRDTP